MTTPVPKASDSGRLRLGFFTSPAVKVTLFHASAENSDPTCATARIVSVPTQTVGPPTPTCTACRAASPAFSQKCPLKLAESAGALRPRKNPKSTRPESAETFAAVKTFWIMAPVFTPNTLTTDNRMTTRMATRFCVLSPTSMLPSTIGPIGIGGTFHKCRIQFEEDMEGKNTPRDLPKATPTAAIVPV